MLWKASEYFSSSTIEDVEGGHEVELAQLRGQLEGGDVEFDDALHGKLFAKGREGERSEIAPGDGPRAQPAPEIDKKPVPDPMSSTSHWDKLMPDFRISRATTCLRTRYIQTLKGTPSPPKPTLSGP